MFTLKVNDYYTSPGQLDPLERNSSGINFRSISQRQATQHLLPEKRKGKGRQGKGKCKGENGKGTGKTERKDPVPRCPLPARVPRPGRRGALLPPAGGGRTSRGHSGDIAGTGPAAGPAGHRAHLAHTLHTPCTPVIHLAHLSHTPQRLHKCRTRLTPSRAPFLHIHPLPPDLLEPPRLSPRSLPALNPLAAGTGPCRNRTLLLPAPLGVISTTQDGPGSPEPTPHSPPIRLSP